VAVTVGSITSIPVLRLFVAALLCSVVLGVPLLLAYGRPVTFVIGVSLSTTVLFGFSMVLAMRSLKGRDPRISWVPKGEFSVQQGVRNTIELVRLGRPGEEDGRRSPGLVMAYSGCVVGIGVAATTRHVVVTALATAIAVAGGWFAHRVGLTGRR
jgi:hypothetical protein